MISQVSYHNQEICASETRGTLGFIVRTIFAANHLTGAITVTTQNLKTKTKIRIQIVARYKGQECGSSVTRPYRLLSQSNDGAMTCLDTY